MQRSAERSLDGLVQSWQAIPQVADWQADLVILLQRQPIGARKVMRYSVAGKQNPHLLKVAHRVKDYFGHVSLMCRRGGEPIDLYEDIKVCGFHPAFQRRQWIGNRPVYLESCLNEQERLSRLFRYRSRYEGAICDDSGLDFRSCIIWPLTSDQVPIVPTIVRQWAKGRHYQADGKKAANCVGFVYDIAMYLGIDLPPAWPHHFRPRVLDRTIEKPVANEGYACVPSRAMAGEVSRLRREQNLFQPLILPSCSPP